MSRTPDRREERLIREGTKVTWNWGDRGQVRGTIREIHNKRVVREIDGVDVIRNGSEEDPALVIDESNGAEVLMLRSEIRVAE